MVDGWGCLRATRTFLVEQMLAVRVALLVVDLGLLLDLPPLLRLRLGHLGEARLGALGLLGAVLDGELVAKLHPLLPLLRRHLS